MTPICDECGEEPADMSLPTEDGEGTIHLCEACLRDLFERVMGGRQEVQ